MMTDVIHDAPAFVANGASWYEASARQRIDGLLDAAVSANSSGRPNA